MSKRKAQGILVFTLALAAFFVYAYLLMLSEWSPIVLQLSMLSCWRGSRCNFLDRIYDGHYKIFAIVNHPR